MAAGDIKVLRENVGGSYDEIVLWNETTVNLTAAGWSTSTQSETISGLTASSDVMVFPPVARAGFLAYGAAQISATAIGTDSITFTCTDTPTTDIENIIVLWR
jgi:hypothetical protein